MSKTITTTTTETKTERVKTYTDMSSLVSDDGGIQYRVVRNRETNEEVRRYPVSANFTPKHPSDICAEYMLNYCIAKGEADLQWYIDILDEDIEVPDKEETNASGKVIRKTPQKPRKRAPAEVKKEFIKRFYPDMLTKANEPRMTQLNLAREALKAMKEAKAEQKKAQKAPTADQAK